MYVIKNRQLEEADDAEDYDYELPSPARLYGSHTNRIPIQSAVQAPRLFYGARFLNQALSLEKGEAPLVQNLNPEDKDGRSFDELQGEALGAVRALKGGKVTSVDSDRIRVAYDDGEEADVDLYDNFVYNQKSGITSRPLVQPGATFTPGQMLAASNYTDDEGTASAGLNARIGLVPWRGFSMDDALPVSESFAKRLAAIQYQTYKQEADPQMRTDLAHYKSLFPDRLPKEMSEKFDEDGKVKAGTILQPGDPIILGTMPRTVRSDGANVGRLSKALQQSRRDASVKWDGNGPAEVIRSIQTKNGIKVALRYVKPADIGDKVVLRAGAKGTISRIIPDDRMPRTEDGQPLDVLLNPLSLLSRANPSTIYEMRLGNIARKLGKPLKVPSYLPKGQNWRDYVRQLEKEHGVKDAEKIFDPDSNRFLTNPVTVGVGYIQRLHHTAEGKGSSRGVASYDCFDDQTEVLTDRGWLPWPQVTKNDALCVPSPDLATASFECPSRLVSHDFDGELMRYESRHLDWAVTDNHEFPVFTGGKHIGKMAADRLRTLSRVCVPQFGFKCASVSPDLKIIPATLAGKAERNLKDLVIPFEDYARFMGWWVAEGSVQEDTGRVYLWQHRRVNPGHSSEIEALMLRIFGKAPMDHKGKGWRIDDYRMAMFLRQEAGHDCYTKRIPRDIITAGPRAVAAFMDAYIKGDGSDGSYTKTDGRKKQNTIRTVGSVSRLLLDDMQEMLMRNGQGIIPRLRAKAGRVLKFLGSDTTYNGADFYSSAIHTRMRATVVPERGLARYTGKWSKLPYRGKVYCATTSTGLLVVRRNGKPVVTGNSNEQPAKGPGENAQAKRFSGLENESVLSAGAYALMRENSTIRGQKSDAYWRALRSGKPLPKASEPFVWNKFRALLAGSGLNTKEHKSGVYRLAPFTSRDLDDKDPIDIDNGSIVNLDTLSPINGGLFDPRIVTGNRWGRIRLPKPVLNPAMEDSTRVMLGLTKQELQDIMAGRAELPERLR